MARSRTALITGVLGQDGQLLSRHLLALGYRVVGIARPGDRSDRVPDRVDLVDARIDDDEAVKAALSEWQPDEIYHLAAAHHSSQEGCDSSRLATKQSMLAANFQGTCALAFGMLGARSKAHLVLAASSQMYTPASVREEITEDSPRRPRTFYGLTKSWGMDLLAFLRADSGLRASTAILFNHESPLRRPQFVTRKITQAAAQARLGADIRLELLNIGDRVDWSSAKDVVRALHLMANQAIGRDYVVASGRLHSVRDVLEIAFGHVGLDWRQYTNYQMDAELPSLVGNSRLLRETLGWHPRVSFEEMIIEMVEDDLRQIA
jgi:GDPmannose 4,6-dehydratase